MSETKRAQTLKQAMALCDDGGDRAVQYGPPSENFWRCATLWSAYHGSEFTAKDVAVMMLLLKVSRMAAPDGGTDDTFVDAAAYAAIANEVK
jgi:hypothetical protein